MMNRLMVSMLAFAISATLGFQTAGAQEKCAERVVAQLEVPDGDLVYEIVGKALKITVRHEMEDDYYAVASTTLNFLSGVKVSTTDRGVQLVLGEQKLTLRGAVGLDGLAPFLDLSGLTVVQDDRDVGFKLATKWTFGYKDERAADPATKSPRKIGGMGFKGTGTGLGGFYGSKARNDATSSKTGYQWYISPLYAAKLNTAETLKRARPCVRDLAVMRVPNPPLEKKTTTSQARP